MLLSYGCRRNVASSLTNFLAFLETDYDCIAPLLLCS